MNDLLKNYFPEIIIGVCICFVMLFLILFYLRRKSVVNEVNVCNGSDKNAYASCLRTEKKEKPKVKPNAVYVFGQFCISDRNKEDITHMLSYKEQLFFILIIFSNKFDVRPADENISAQMGFEDMDDFHCFRKEAMKHISCVINRMDGISLNYSASLYRLTIEPPFYCDYLHFAQLMDEWSTYGRAVPGMMDEFLQLLNRGQCLWAFKQESANFMRHFSLFSDINIFFFIELQYEFMRENYRNVIRVASALLRYNPLDEMAFSFAFHSLMKDKRTEDAALLFNRFSTIFMKQVQRSYAYTYITSQIDKRIYNEEWPNRHAYERYCY